MTFGFATAEFQVTTERLGCYLWLAVTHLNYYDLLKHLYSTTHIDNPKVKKAKQLLYLHTHT